MDTEPAPLWQGWSAPRPLRLEGRRWLRDAFGVFSPLLASLLEQA